MMMPPIDTTIFLVDEASVNPTSDSCSGLYVGLNVSSNSNSSSSNNNSRDDVADEKFVSKKLNNNNNNNNYYNVVTESLSTETTMRESYDYYEECDEDKEEEGIGYYNDEDDRETGVDSIQCRRIQYDDRRYSASGPSTCNSSSSNGGFVGGWLSDFRSLAICIKDTAGDVASFVHTTALNVANEIKMMDDEYQQDQEEIRLRQLQDEKEIYTDEVQDDEEEEVQQTAKGNIKANEFANEIELDENTTLLVQKENISLIDFSSDRYSTLSVTTRHSPKDCTNNEEKGNEGCLSKLINDDSDRSQNSLVSADDDKGDEDDDDDEISIHSDYYDSDADCENHSDDNKIIGSSRTTKTTTTWEPSMNKKVIETKDDDHDDDSYIFCNSDNNPTDINNSQPVRLSSSSPPPPQLLILSVSSQSSLSRQNYVLPSAPPSTNSLGSIVLVDGNQRE